MWPSFIVGKVGTDLHTTDFDPLVASRLRERVAPLGALIKGHYTDWVSNPESYPQVGMGGANVGPEFTEAELAALLDLERTESNILQRERDLASSRFSDTLEQAVQQSNRWQKWLLPDEMECRTLAELKEERRRWIVGTCARYIWRQPAVEAARERLYHNVSNQIADPHGRVVERIMGCIAHYATAFNLIGSLDTLTGD